MTYTVTTGPSSEPVTVAEVKLALRLDGSDLDTDIAMLIQSARELAEHETGVVLLPQTLKLELTSWPAALTLIRAPVRGVASVEYWDGAAWQTISNTLYKVYQDGVIWRIDPVSTWPSLGTGAGPRVRVVFTAGYDDAAHVPACVKRWIIAQVGQWLRSPEAGSDRKVEINPFMARQLDPVRIYA